MQDRFFHCLVILTVIGSLISFSALFTADRSWTRALASKLLRKGSRVVDSYNPLKSGWSALLERVGYVAHVDSPTDGVDGDAGQYVICHLAGLSTGAVASSTTSNGSLLGVVYERLYTHLLTLNQTDVKKCAEAPSHLNGTIDVYECGASMPSLERLGFNVELGGRYRPSHCMPRSKAAIIIPFRNRFRHLSDFLLNMHPFLQRQELEYAIYVINQEEGSKFNRGMLLNIGAVEASKVDDYDCYFFHDVDLLPENDRNVYRCPQAFQHFSVAVDKFHYALPYKAIAGGVIAANKSTFMKVNGYSNLFFGWGGEDDDFSKRISSNGYALRRYGAGIARYKMIKHDRDSGNEDNPERFMLLKAAPTRRLTDGLNSLVYKVEKVDYRKLYTWVSVTISQQEVMNQFHSVVAQPRIRSGSDGFSNGGIERE